MGRTILSLFFLTFLMSSLIIFQNCGKGGRHNTSRIATAQTNFGNTSYQPSQELNAFSSIEKTSPEQLANDLYKRLAGTTLSKLNPDYTTIVEAIKNGQPEKAAEMAIKTNSFYTITLRDFAGKMSTREGTTLAPLSDFVATIMGVVRDDLPATDLLTGNFYYRVRGVANVSDDIQTAIVSSNKHYEKLEDVANYPSLLEKEEGQKILTPNGSIATQTDAAGLLTSRAFMLAHANAGTNRRMIEYTFKVFECMSIDSWASTSNPDDHVGRDIGRFPIEEYNNKCKGCHTGMDAMRPATAYYDFFMTNEPTKEGYIKYKFNYSTDPDPNNATGTIPVPSDQQLVSSKFRRGTDTFPDGFVVKNENWVNYADPNVFGWTITSGSGMNDLGNMIAYSDGFRRCMVKRVFSSVCKYDLTGTDSALTNSLADSFKYDGYNLKKLFMKVALRPECLGVGL